METGMNGVLRWMILPLVSLLLAASHAAALDTSAPVLAPLNPDFVGYLDHAAGLPARQAQALQAEAEDEHALGYLPEPIDMSHLNGQRSVLSFEQLGLPLSYDLRPLGKVTPVRNQGKCGSCWAFATMGSAESNLLPAEGRDLSENNLKNTAGFLWGPCEGGNAAMATAYLARGSGPVYESDDPYNASSGSSPSGLSARKQYQDVLYIPGRAGSLDNDAIKQAIMKYGAVMTSYYDEHGNSSIYHPATHGYYYTGPNSSNHAVTIVGWDDNYPRSNFATLPPGDGAFIIKNSWGTSWGENGYFSISYYDSRMGLNGNFVFRMPDSATNFSRIYQYDPLGNTSNIGYSSSTGWFANIFTASAGEYLSAVSFYAGAPYSTYEISIYTNTASSPTSGTLSSSTIGSITEAGYHTVQIIDPVLLASGQRFSIVVKLTTPGFKFPIPIECPVGGYAAATANPGESYVSSTGATWSDITSFYADSNVCLKGFTSPAGRIISGITINGSSYVTENSSAAFTASANWSDGTISAVTPAWSITPTSYASISADGLLTVSALPGDQTIAVTASHLSGGVTNSTTKNVTFVKFIGDCDIDRNSAVNIADALYTLRVAVGIVPETAAVISRGDMNRDGNIDISDALFILRRVVGLI